MRKDSKQKDKKTNNPSSNNITKPMKNKSSKKYYKVDKKKEEKPSFSICPICSKEVKDRLTAIKEKTTKEDAHFNCITSKIKKSFDIKNKDKIYYIGGGRFALVKEKRFKNRFSFTIKEKINYCEKTKN